MARTSLGALISRVRVLINDPAGAGQTFTDDAIQDTLDAGRTERRWVALRPVPTFTASGVLYYDYFSDAGAWESDYALQDLSFRDISAQVTLFEPFVGHWQLSAQPSGIGVRATGKTYDLYGASADLLEAHAARLMLAFDFADGGQVLKRSQQQAMTLALAQQYRRLALPRSGRLVQSDAAPDVDGGGVVYPSVRGEGTG